MFRSTCRHRPILTVGSVIYVIQAWKFSAFPRISALCLPRCYFFTLKTRVFIAKRTKNRNVGPTKLRKTNIKIESTILPRIEMIMTGIRAHICQVSRFWRDIPILDPPKPKLGPRILLGRSDFQFLMIKKKTIIITDPGNRHYGNRKSWEKVQSTHYHVTCQLFIIKASWISWSLQLHKKRVQINSFALTFSSLIHAKS